MNYFRGKARSAGFYCVRQIAGLARRNSAERPSGGEKQFSRGRRNYRHPPQRGSRPRLIINLALVALSFLLRVETNAQELHDPVEELERLTHSWREAQDVIVDYRCEYSETSRVYDEMTKALVSRSRNGWLLYSSDTLMRFGTTFQQSSDPELPELALSGQFEYLRSGDRFCGLEMPGMLIRCFDSVQEHREAWSILHTMGPEFIRYSNEIPGQRVSPAEYLESLRPRWSDFEVRKKEGREVELLLRHEEVTILRFVVEIPSDFLLSMEAFDPATGQQLMRWRQESVELAPGVYLASKIDYESYLRGANPVRKRMAYQSSLSNIRRISSSEDSSLHSIEDLLDSAPDGSDFVKVGLQGAMVHFTKVGGEWPLEVHRLTSGIVPLNRSAGPAPDSNLSNKGGFDRSRVRLLLGVAFLAVVVMVFFVGKNLLRPTMGKSKR